MSRGVADQLLLPWGVRYKKQGLVHSCDLSRKKKSCFSPPGVWGESHLSGRSRDLVSEMSCPLGLHDCFMGGFGKELPGEMSAVFVTWAPLEETGVFNPH